jgi:hypothetical protein
MKSTTAALTIGSLLLLTSYSSAGGLKLFRHRQPGPCPCPTPMVGPPQHGLAVAPIWFSVWVWKDIERGKKDWVRVALNIRSPKAAADVRKRYHVLFQQQAEVVPHAPGQKPTKPSTSPSTSSLEPGNPSEPEPTVTLCVCINYWWTAVGDFVDPNDAYIACLAYAPSECKTVTYGQPCCDDITVPCLCPGYISPPSLPFIVSVGPRAPAMYPAPCNVVVPQPYYPVVRRRLFCR